MDTLVAVSYTHLDVYKRQGLGRCFNLWTSPIGAVIHRSITCHSLLDLVGRMASPEVKPILYDLLKCVLLGSDVIKFLIKIVIIYFIKFMLPM